MKVSLWLKKDANISLQALHYRKAEEKDTNIYSHGEPCRPDHRQRMRLSLV